MRNLRLVDAVIALHEIRKLVEEECGACEVSVSIGKCADDLHHISIQDAKNSVIADQVIQKAKE